LSTNDGVGVGSTQTAASADPLLLHFPWGGNHDDPVDVAIPPGFQQQRNIQHGEALPGKPNPAQECSLLLPDHRMQNTLKLPQGIRLPQHNVPQRNSIYCPVCYSAGKSCFDGWHRATAPRLQPVDSSICVKHRDTSSTKYRRGSRLPHADPAGQPNDLHPPVRSAATNCRSS
jgi:hypothetical protein